MPRLKKINNPPLSLEHTPVSLAPLPVHWVTVTSNLRPASPMAFSLLPKSTDGPIPPPSLPSSLGWDVTPPASANLTINLHSLPPAPLSLSDLSMLTFPRASLVLGPFFWWPHSVMWLWFPFKLGPNLDLRPCPSIWTPALSNYLNSSEWMSHRCSNWAHLDSWPPLLNAYSTTSSSSALISFKETTVEGGDICIIMTDLCRCMAETNTTL